MSVHLIKLCVGAESFDDLAAWQTRLVARLSAAGADPAPFHVTRQTPKRAAELLDGGSIYWVIKGLIRARQPIVALEETRDDQGVRACRLVFDPALVETEPTPRKAFQGWRYLDIRDAPADLASSAGVGAELPEALRAELRAIGAW